MFCNSPLVVGYKGEIGSFILQGLLRTMPKALNIWCFDVNESEKEKIERIRKSDYIFLCVPMQNTVEWVKKYKRFLKGKIIIEQTSLKESVFGKKGKVKSPAEILSMHILFRPSITPNKTDRRVALIGSYSHWPINFRRDIEAITNSQAIVFRTCEEHDAAMAANQALVHRVILALGKCLYDIGQTYATQKIKELEERILHGDETLYKLIQKNKYLPDKLREFERNLKRFEFPKKE